MRWFAAEQGEDDGEGGNFLLGFASVNMAVPTMVVASPMEVRSRRKFPKTEAASRRRRRGGGGRFGGEGVKEKKEKQRR